ncbi:hypothetical protein GCM10009096_22260 [Parasphingorhabdus litoris]|uniref:Carboxyltransferase domain-containing protein n=1 Tax=Parasphingorhabdus litoris TaxID=394733 RepID=A0ABN1AM37_9SPHN|nr:allophanate hydrolase subunit 1 [Parasphingorhabdus litoris]
MSAGDIHACDDWLCCPLKNLEEAQAAIAACREEEKWQEVVTGLDSIAVQFDPAVMSPDEAIDLFTEQLLHPSIASIGSSTPITIPICYDPEFAPDREWLAEKMGLSADALIAWHSGLSFKVTMLGFMPGFAYLQCQEAIADIGRLPKPRQKVPAGSVGIIGDQSCVYSFDSPGGWPIVGRTPLKLFDPNRDDPALLSANQSVCFEPIDRAEYETIKAKQDSEDSA